MKRKKTVALGPPICSQHEGIVVRFNVDVSTLSRLLSAVQVVIRIVAWFYDLWPY